MLFAIWGKKYLEFFVLWIPGVNQFGMPELVWWRSFFQLRAQNANILVRYTTQVVISKVFTLIEAMEMIISIVFDHLLTGIRWTDILCHCFISYDSGAINMKSLKDKHVSKFANKNLVMVGKICPFSCQIGCFIIYFGQNEGNDTTWTIISNGTVTDKIERISSNSAHVSLSNLAAKHENEVINGSCRSAKSYGNAQDGSLSRVNLCQQNQSLGHLRRLSIDIMKKIRKISRNQWDIHWKVVLYGYDDESKETIGYSEVHTVEDGNKVPWDS